MGSKSLPNETLANLVEQALRIPESERESFLRDACGSDSQLFAAALKYARTDKCASQPATVHSPDDPSPDGSVLVSPECKRLFEPGQLIIRRFRIVREVAQGGMGIVWEAFDEKIGLRVALKCAKAGFGTNLPPEVRNAREISHPNVCRVFEIHTVSTDEGDVDFISMEFLEGETLTDRIRHGPLSDVEARTIAKQLCLGLAEAHRHGLIHGDLTTNNVILTKDSDQSVRAVLTDFGLAQVVSASIGVLGGTPGYMAPELWKGEKPSPASDIYALGVLLWELHAGRFFHELGGQFSTVPVGEQFIWKPPPGKGQWNRIVARCVRPDPATRFQSATAVAQAFGPSHIWQIVVAIALLICVPVAALVIGTRALHPSDEVRLALLAPKLNPSDPSMRRLLDSTAAQLTVLKGSDRTALHFLSWDQALQNHVQTWDEARRRLGATHALRVTLEPRAASLYVHAYLRDLRTGLDRREWGETYAPSQLRYAPVALAAVITGNFHLQPPTTASTLNSAARKDYEKGIAALRFDKTLNQSLDHLQRAVALDPDSALPWAGLAEAQAFKKALGGNAALSRLSEESARQAQLRNPDLAAVHCIVGRLKADSGHYEQAIADYLRTIELDPTNADAYRRLGQAYEHNQQLDEALTAFRKSIQVDPSQTRNYRALANFYFLRARNDEAIAEYRKALTFSPDDAFLRYRLGVAYQNAGNFSLAENELRASLRSDETPSTLHTLGVLLLYQRREQEAVNIILQSLQKGPEKSPRWMNLGTAYRRLGLQSQSDHAYRRGMELAEKELTDNPRDPLVRTYLAYLSARTGDRARSRSELAQALQQSPNDADVLFIAANTLEALGLRNETLSLLSTAPAGVLADLSRWPDLSDLQDDLHFKQLLNLREGKH